MNSNEQTAIDILNSLLKVGDRLLSLSANESKVALQRWVCIAPKMLSKIYGANAPQLAYFSQVDSRMPDHLARDELVRRIKHIERMIKGLKALPEETKLTKDRIFIGHGHSRLWKDLKDYISDELRLPWEEFNREPVAGYSTTERLKDMISKAAFAFIIMTAEDEHADATFHARSNVIHEAGLFQGKLGWNRAIVMLEEGCHEFSNIEGLGRIEFPKNNIEAKFHEVRLVLKREGLIQD